MITTLKLKNFRSFAEKEFFFERNMNLVVGENGKGKTNILEAIALLSGNDLIHVENESLVTYGENIFFIGADDTDGKQLVLGYDKTLNKKKHIIQLKATTKKKMQETFGPVVMFHPMLMNMMYMGPKYRRDFINTILSQAFPEYGPILKKYKNITTSRNRILKSIRDGHSTRGEITFWNEQFILFATRIYSYRFQLIDFFQKNEKKLVQYFEGKVPDVHIHYKTKVSKTCEELSEYLTENLERDIIIGKTQIGPHTDDLEIHVLEHQLTSFASRWEVKSIMIGLKFLEIAFIQEYTGKTPLLLIDDLLSEIDHNHQKTILSNIWNYQSIITSITDIEAFSGNKIFL